MGAKFDAAFTFTHFETSRHGALRRRGSDDTPVPGDGGGGGGIPYLGDETKPVDLDLGQSASLWSRAEDFWHAVGWAFNCSILHPGRWEIWRLWLEFMCEVLEDDWSERLKMSEKAGGDDEPLKQSLIFRYIDRGSLGFGRNRRILRAIFADGGSTAASEFGQVFPKELESSRGGDGNDNIKKRETAAVNVDAEQFGDYLSNDEDKETESEDGQTDAKPSRKRPRRGTRNTTKETSTPSSTTSNTSITLLGPLPSLTLRQRLLSLLSCVSNRLPNSFLPLDDLYHLFIENIRHLPLPIFQSFISPSTLSAFSQSQQVTLCDYLLFRMLESSAPNADAGDNCLLTQKKLEECFLPFAANTTSPVDNAKVSITLEALVVLLAGDDLVTVTEGFRTAVQTGVLARVEKAGSAEGKKKGPKVQDLERCWLLESGDRLVFLVDEVLKKATAG